MSGLGSPLCAVALVAELLTVAAQPLYSHGKSSSAKAAMHLEAAGLEALSRHMLSVEYKQYEFVLLRLATDPNIERDALLRWGFEPEERFVGELPTDDLEFDSVAIVEDVSRDEQVTGLDLLFLDECPDSLRQIAALRQFKVLLVVGSPEVASLLPEIIRHNPLLLVQLDESVHPENLLDECARSASLRALHVECPAKDVAITQGFTALERLWLIHSQPGRSCRIENLPQLEYLNIDSSDLGELLAIGDLPHLQRLDLAAWENTKEIRLTNLPALSHMPESQLVGQLLIVEGVPASGALHLRIEAETARRGDFIGVSLRSLPALEELTIDCGRIGSAEVTAQLVGLPSLRRLDWFACPAIEGLVEYLGSRTLGAGPKALREMTLAGVSLNAEFFAACGRLPALDRLSLDDCAFDSTALAELGAAGRPPRELQIGWDDYCWHYAEISELRVESLVIGPADPFVVIPGQHRWLATASPLAAAGLTLSDAGLKNWEEERLLLHSQELRSLAISVSEYDECFFAVLPELPRLERLSIAYHETCDGALSAGLNGCLSLRELELREVSVSAGVLQTIQQMPRLRTLTLTDCPNLLQIVPSLAECKQLEVLSLRQSRERPEDPISPELLLLQSTLRERLPNVQVEVR